MWFVVFIKYYLLNLILYYKNWLLKKELRYKKSIYKMVSNLFYKILL